MKKLATLALGFVLGSSISLLSFANTPNGAKESVEAIANSYNRMAEVWPGFTLPGLGTIVKYFQSDVDASLYAFDFTPKDPSQWQKLDVLNRTVYYMPKNVIHLPDSFYDTITVDNQPVILGEISGNPVEDVITLNLYRFVYHIYNNFYPRPFKWQAVTLDDFNNIEYMQLFFLEMEAVKSWLQNSNVDTLKDMLAIEQYRARFMSGNTKKFERESERTFGTAIYVGLKSAHLNEKEENKNILDGINFPSPVSGGAEYDMFDTTGYVMNSIGMAIGAMTGLALDRIHDTQWKMTVEKNDIQPLTLLIKHYPMSESEMTQRVDAASAKYHAEKFSTLLKNTIEKNAAVVAEIARQFAASPNTEVNLVFTTDDEKSSGTSSGSDVTVDSDTNAYVKYSKSIDYKNSGFHDEYTDIPYVYTSSKTVETGMPLNRDENSDRLKLSPDTHLVLDGKQTTLGEFAHANKPVSFHQLAISGPNVNIKTGKDVEGKAEAVNGVITLRMAYKTTAK